MNSYLAHLVDRTLARVARVHPAFTPLYEEQGTARETMPDGSTEWGKAGGAIHSQPVERLDPVTVSAAAHQPRQFPPEWRTESADPNSTSVRDRAEDMNEPRGGTTESDRRDDRSGPAKTPLSNYWTPSPAAQVHPLTREHSFSIVPLGHQESLGFRRGMSLSQPGAERLSDDGGERAIKDRQHNVVPVSSRRAPPDVNRNPPDAKEVTPTINVTIGRVEISAIPPKGGLVHDRKERRTVLSLDEYMRRRAGGDRS